MLLYVSAIIYYILYYNKYNTLSIFFFVRDFYSILNECQNRTGQKVSFVKNNFKKFEKRLNIATHWALVVEF